MANKKISELNSLTSSSLATNDLFVVVDVSAPTTPTGETKNIELGELKDYMNGSLLTSGEYFIDLTATNHVSQTSINAGAKITTDGTIWSKSGSLGVGQVNYLGAAVNEFLISSSGSRIVIGRFSGGSTVPANIEAGTFYGTASYFDRLTVVGTNALDVGGLSVSTPGANSVQIHDAAATADNSVAIGVDSFVDESNGIAIGNNAGVDTSGIGGISIGNASRVSKTNGIAIGGDTISSQAGAISIGGVAVTTGTGSIAIGEEATVSSNYGTAIGFNASVTKDSSAAFGARVRNTRELTAELGVWTSTSTREAGVRLDGSSSMVGLTLENSGNAPQDGGATMGSETTGSLMREAYAIRRNGDALFIDVNIGGVIKTLSLGTAT